MNYFMLKMTWTNQNGKASLAPEKVREFISQTHLIGIGSHVTRGFIVFRNLRKGDIVLVLGKHIFADPYQNIVDTRLASGLRKGIGGVVYLSYLEYPVRNIGCKLRFLLCRYDMAGVKEARDGYEVEVVFKYDGGKLDEDRALTGDPYGLVDLLGPYKKYVSTVQFVLNIVYPIFAVIFQDHGEFRGIMPVGRKDFRAFFVCNRYSGRGIEYYFFVFNFVHNTIIAKNGQKSTNN